MKVSHNWLKDYVALTCSPAEVAHELTMLGLEVESLEKTNRDFQGIVIGKVQSITPMQAGNKLKVCTVDIGTRRITAVCGAPNVAEGQAVPFALAGAKISDELTIEQRRFGDTVSQGMICSEAELGLSSRGEGIMVLDGECSIGADFTSWLGPEDYIFELNVTPNRADCLSVIGIARELATKYKLPLQCAPVKITESTEKNVDFIDVRIEDEIGCPRYSARYLSSITIGPSPWWLVNRLESVGVRSINNVVDITNFVMMEYGQPLHAFDYEFLEGAKITVKRALAGEKFITLDDKEHTLRNDTLMICDGAKSVAIAGVMGGQNSEVSENTSRVLLESAYFDPLSVRLTSKYLGISTESSFRFERGIDPSSVVLASDRASQLMAQLCGASIAQGLKDVYPRKIVPQRIALRKKRLAHVIGAEVTEKECIDILTRLGFEVEPGEPLQIIVPTNRPDVYREIDLIEEVARVRGYDKVPLKTSVSIDLSTQTTYANEFEEHLRDGMVNLGYHEVLTLSLVKPSSAKPFLDEWNKLRLLKNPLNEELSALRPSLLPGLLQACSHNRNRGLHDVRIFEIGRCFQETSEQKESSAQEWKVITGLLMGRISPKTWGNTERNFSIFDLKGHVIQLCQRSKLPPPTFQRGEYRRFFEGGLILSQDGIDIGECGMLATEVLEIFELEDKEIFAFEINLTKVKEFENAEVMYQSIPKYPAALRDLSVVVDYSIAVGDMLHEIKKRGGSTLNNVDLLDLFTGKQIPVGKKSLTFSLRFQDPNRTLRDEEVDATFSEIFNGLEKKFNASLRTQ